MLALLLALFLVRYFAVIGSSGLTAYFTRGELVCF